MTLLAWQRAGSVGPAVVLVHGWASDGPADWQATGWVEALEGAGCTVYVPDLPGHGESADVHPPARAPAAWCAQVLLADLAKLGVADCGAVGYADGCYVAGHLAVQAPHLVTRLVLVGCDDRAGMANGRDIAAALRDPSARVWNPEVSDAVARARRDRRNDLGSLANLAEHATWPAAPRLGALRTPVLLAVGADDTDRRDRVPRLAQLFHDARVVTAPGDRSGALASDRLQATAARFVTDQR